MELAESRRARLSGLLELAQSYRGWSRRELATAIGRDPTKIIPGSGIPKIDLVADLARVLDWRVEDVVEAIWDAPEHRPADRPGSEPDAGGFEAIDKAARDAHRSGNYLKMIELARRGYAAAGTPDERARSRNREAGGWDGLGRYQDALKAIRAGLDETGLSPDLRRMLQSNLANAYYTLWMPMEARAIAAELLMQDAIAQPQSPRDVRTRLFAHYVAGHSARRMLEREIDHSIAEDGMRHLILARDGYRSLSDASGDQSFAGIANTCEGGIIEIDAVTGSLPGPQAIERLMDGLDVTADGFDGLTGDWIESIGWWCIFGCNVALRKLDDEAAVQRAMAVFTNKADEIAEHLNSWPMRERVFTMGHMRWERAVGVVGFEIPRVLDEDEVRVITGAMSRFPAFRDTGWAILRSAGILEGSES